MVLVVSLASDLARTHLPNLTLCELVLLHHEACSAEAANYAFLRVADEDEMGGKIRTQ